MGEGALKSTSPVLGCWEAVCSYEYWKHVRQGIILSLCGEVSVLRVFYDTFALSQVVFEHEDGWCSLWNCATWEARWQFGSSIVPALVLDGDEHDLLC